MRRFILAVLMLTLALAADVHANSCTVEDQLTAYLQKNAPARAQVLAFDHLTRRWSGYTWDTGRTPALKTDEDGFTDLALAKPRMLNDGTDVIVVVTNTNPLLYVAGQKAAERVDSADLAALQALALNIGGVLQFATVAAGQRDEISSLQRLSIRNASADTQARINAFQIEAVPSEMEPDDLAAIATMFIAALDVEAGKLKDPLKRLQDEASALKGNVDLATSRGSALNSLVQILESGQTPSDFLPHQPADILLPQTIERNFVSLGNEILSIRKVETLCGAESDAAAIAVGHKRFGYPSNARRKEAARKEFDEAVDALVGAGGKSCDGGTRDAMRLLGRWLADSPPGNAPVTDEDQSTALSVIENAALRFATVRSKTAAAIEKGTESLKERFKPVQTAARVVQVANILASYDTTKPCTLSAGVIEVDRRINPLANLPFGKESEETITISANPAFPDIEKRHPVPVEVTYRIAKRRKVDFDVDVSLVYTDLTSPTFGVKAIDPAPATGDKYEIIRKSEKSRAGDLAAMLTMKGAGIAKYVNPQVGAGVTADRPALFAGLAFPIGPYFKFSGGWTWQKVTKLANGQKEGDPISGEDALKTRDGFGDSWYASLSITLDNLTFFKRP